MAVFTENAGADTVHLGKKTLKERDSVTQRSACPQLVHECGLAC